MTGDPQELELAPDIARVRGLYKLLPLTFPLTVLEIVTNDQPSVCFEQNAIAAMQLMSANLIRLGYNEVEECNVQVHGLNYLFDEWEGKEKYDLVIVHGTLSQLKNRVREAGLATTNRHLFTAMGNLLSPRGMIAGCIQNSFSAAGIISLLDKKMKASCLSFPGLRSALQHGGFRQPRIFSLYPDVCAPIMLAEVNYYPSVAHSKEQIDYLRNWLGKPNYVLKLIFSLLGIGLWFDDHYFFYARKS